MTTLWIIGGIDPTGGAGVGRDRAVASAVAPALAVVTVLTAVTQQGDGRPARAEPTESAALRAALTRVAEAGAVKIGLVPAACVDVVAQAVATLRCPRVLDPVLRASDGGDMGADAESLLRLAAQVDLVTPNRAEAIALLGDVPGDDAALVAAVRRLGPASLLLKDGHGDDPAWVCDRLVVGDACHRFARRRRAGPDPRGTGCALATAIACGMAGGVPLVDACGAAIAWLDEARTHTIFGPDGRPHLSL